MNSYSVSVSGRGFLVTRHPGKAGRASRKMVIQGGACQKLDGARERGGVEAWPLPQHWVGVDQVPRPT